MGASEEVDVVIVGAGLAGLYAARTIQKRAPDLTILGEVGARTDDVLQMRVLEAKDRVGGRTKSAMLKTQGGGQELWDLGGQWVGRTQQHILHLLQELKVETFEQYTSGRKRIQIGGRRVRSYTDSLPTMSDLTQFSPLEALDFLRFLLTVEKLATRGMIFDNSFCTILTLTKALDVDFEQQGLKIFVRLSEDAQRHLNIVQTKYEEPFADGQAGEWDELTVAEFARQFCWTRTLMDSADIICRAVFGTTADRISVAYVVGYGNAAGTVRDLLEAVGDGAQKLRIKGGSEQLSRHMAEDLGDGVVGLRRVVVALRQHSEGVRLTHVAADSLGDPVEVRCHRVIMAIPPQEAAKIRYEPPLPQSRHQLLAAFPMGNLLKFVITYKRSFWREAGLSGEIVASGRRQSQGKVDLKDVAIPPISITYDGTTDSGAPAIVGFCNTEWAERPFEERREAVLENLADYFGEEARDFIDYADKDWAAEPFNGGCPVGILPPGYMEAFSHIRDPVNRLHWAGTETGTRWTGYMSGAVQSGLRAAAEVLHHLRPHIIPSQEDLEGSVYANAYKAPKPKDDSFATKRGHLISLVFAVTSAALAVFLVKKLRMK